MLIKTNENYLDTQLLIDDFNQFKYPHLLEEALDGQLTEKVLKDHYLDLKSKMNGFAEATNYFYDKIQ